MLSAMGIDGVLLSWPRYEEGMREFGDATYPLLVQSGLRGESVMATTRLDLENTTSRPDAI